MGKLTNSSAVDVATATNFRHRTPSIGHYSEEKRRRYRQPSHLPHKAFRITETSSSSTARVQEGSSYPLEEKPVVEMSQNHFRISSALPTSRYSAKLERRPRHQNHHHHRHHHFRPRPRFGSRHEMSDEPSDIDADNIYDVELERVAADLASGQIAYEKSGRFPPQYVFDSRKSFEKPILCNFQLSETYKPQYHGYDPNPYRMLILQKVFVRTNWRRQGVFTSFLADLVRLTRPEVVVVDRVDSERGPAMKKWCEKHGYLSILEKDKTYQFFKVLPKIEDKEEDEEDEDEEDEEMNED